MKAHAMRFTSRTANYWMLQGLLLLIILFFTSAPVLAADYGGIFNYGELYGPRNTLKRHASPAPGQLLDIGTHRLHLYCTGNGSPVVLVDTGLGATSLEWFHVQESLQQHSRICLYDRAGYGWSDPGPLPRTSSIIVEELHLLLQKAGIQGPFVLVGHSFGGYNMQLFASRFRDQVAGIVLVDSSHPGQYERFIAPPIRFKTAPAENLQGARIYRFALPSLHPNLPGYLHGTVRMMMLGESMRMAMADEYYDFRKSARQVIEGGSLPDVPLLVLSRGKRVYPETGRGDLMETLWLQLQSELAMKSEYAAHVVANNSGHHIHLDEPHLVTDSIAMIVEMGRLHVAGPGTGKMTRFSPEPAWFAFSGATWLSDTLHTRLTLGPAYPSQNGYQSLGRSTDPLMLTWHNPLH